MTDFTATLTIRETASRTGLTTHTLRYYERLGLIVADRSASGHRRYRSSDIEWINVLICLRDTGMPIHRMIEFARLVRKGESTVPNRLALLETHRGDVLANIDRYRRYLKVIEQKIRAYSTLKTPDGR
jgi:DNA-binding transcriptional MerR regulator